MYGDGPLSGLAEGGEAYDFVFLPHYSIDDIELPRIDLGINMVSFQEMTTEQVERYVRRLHEAGCPHFYSLNRDVSRYNTQLSSVSTVIGRYYDTTEIDVLPVQYTELRVPPPRLPAWRELAATIGNPKSAKRALVRWLLARGSGRSPHVYRHLAGPRRELG
jgi:hypothetical protein